MPPEEGSQVVGGAVESVAPAGMDMDAAVANIADSLQLVGEEPPEEPAEKPEGEEAAAPAEKPEAAPAAAPAAADPTDVAPDTWRKEAKEAWVTIPPVVKDEMRKREADIAGYVERVKVPVSVGEKFTEILTPYLQQFEKSGVNPWDNLKAMLTAQDRLLNGAPEEKLAMFQALAQNVGIKLEGGQLSAVPDAQTNYIKSLEQRLATLEGGVKTVTSTVQEARQAELESNVLKFAEDTAAHPFFNDVADQMSNLIRVGAAKDLESAYQTAVAADPILRSKVIDAEATRVAKQKAEEDAKKVIGARKTAGANVRSSTGRRPEQALGSIDDTLKETLADIRTRH